MMNLIIDVGNTFTKLAVFDKGDLIEKIVIEGDQTLSQLKVLKKNYPSIINTIISVVGEWQQELKTYLKENYDSLFLDNTTKVPFENLYHTPKTLGIDRIALASASVAQFSDKNVLILDAGTCITYDFVNTKNQYLGGAIALGMNSRYRALHEFTAKLPLLEPKSGADLIGVDTHSSMHSGVINGLLFEIESVISEYKKQFPDLTVVLTGGDANFLAKQLKSTIFVNQNFLLEGLNFILEYNKN